MTLDMLALMIGEGFNGVDKKFAGIDQKFAVMDQKFEKITKEMNQNFSEVKQQINTININAVDVVRKEDFDKLENRVVDVEEVLKLKLHPGK